MFSKCYSLKKSRHTMKAGYQWYCKKGQTIAPDKLSLFESHLQLLDQALLSKDRKTADLYAKKVSEFCLAHFKKTPLMHLRELFVALLFALVVAIVIRQMWFELYEIPTGSMRPTYQEKDHLTVSKTQFGINKLLQPGHFYFDPDLVKRTGTIIFLGDNLPIDDATSYYFDLIPYSKRFIKRLIGKPGDTLYFYGGKIYGIDKNDKPLKELLNAPWMQPLEHIPFLNFEGRPSYSSNRIVIKQMNEPVGRITVGPTLTKGEVFNGSDWVPDMPSNQPHSKIETYSDLWGIRNFAMTRLLTKEELSKEPGLDIRGLAETPLYLELSHTPILVPANQSSLFTYKTVLPLTDAHLNTLMHHMYTTRFIVNEEKAHSYNGGSNKGSKRDPLFSGVPNGTYQFDKGTAEEVGLGAILYTLPSSHPLQKSTPQAIQRLYNLGIEFNQIFQPLPGHPFPNRYAYFRDGDLFLLGAPIIKKDDPALEEFHKREKHRSLISNYIAFKDNGAPLTASGELDILFLKTFGLKVPEKTYLMLGDNHAVSADSRFMGFIPEDNLHGIPDLLLWPPGNRWLYPDHEPYPILTTPRLIVWTIASIFGLIALIYYRLERQRPIFRAREFLR